MAGTLQGKVVVITGASTGIGRAAAAVFGREGARLVLASRRADRLDDALREMADAGYEAIAVPTDIGDFAQVQALADAAMEAFGRVDVAFLNAGLAGAGSLLDIDLDAWHTAVDTNLYGLVHGIKAFLPLLSGSDVPGSLLATTSAAGIHGTSYNTGAYAATKTAQLSIMEALYGQLRNAKSGVHVGVVVPPLTRTNLAGDDLGVWQQIEANLAGRKGAPALIEPQEFAEVVLEGLRDRLFWIEATPEQNERLYGGRDAGAPARKAHMLNARTESMLARQPPDRYLW
ncbi:MAG TPA: SDR family NAD(P)-dependent oxidoreductase [Frankiaceae bacterium]|nr:SDR family NAD(P)-dependent oxidoreductase [Frankiaceae bacterium]